MILWISIIYIFHLCMSEIRPPYQSKERRCLLSHMTDVQSWVNKDGKLLVNGIQAIDLSHSPNVTNALRELTQTRVESIQYLSLATCWLHQVPPIFTIRGNLESTISESVEYMTLYGNVFGRTHNADSYESFINATFAKEVNLRPSSNSKVSTWDEGFKDVKFPRLRQLDLRACRIDFLDAFTFIGMPSLTHLYIGENEITFINAHAFVGLWNIVHIDLSNNIMMDEINPVKVLTFESLDMFTELNLKSLDLSFTALGISHIPLMGRLGNNLERLSLCHTAVQELRPNCFGRSPVKFLDVSCNSNVLSGEKTLQGLENTLRVLYAHSTLLRSLAFIRGFEKLEILKLNDNDISELPKNTLETLNNLKILDLANNRISTWSFPGFSRIPQLNMLLLNNNNINIISDIIVRDISKVKYLSLSKNSMICHCVTRELYEVAYRNELRIRPTLFKITTDDNTMFNTGYTEYNNMIKRRRNLTTPCLKIGNSHTRFDCFKGYSVNISGDYLFLDYDVESYRCVTFDAGKRNPINNEPTCSQELREMPENLVVATKGNMMLLLILLIILPILAFVYVFRRNFRYFLITVRNSALLSSINEKNDYFGDNKLFNYDVFVSYCNEDKAWVLDHLLPHVETDCNISVCLHERDFQVGLSILENIVTCMDRSRSIMLVISKRFLLSQWCQFEMHLAQHRLLETRREDLILILLEEIPRRLRPNTLHFLMLTKTYIVWSKEESERKEFWRRMKRSLDMQKLKNGANDSLA